VQLVFENLNFNLNASVTSSDFAQCNGAKLYREHLKT